MTIGNWKINVNVSGMPQKVATAVGKINEMIIGADYTPIAYLGSQVVNGTNHAVLAEQIVLTGYDTKNIVVLVFNEKPGDIDLTLVGIDRVFESGDALGGTTIDAKTDIPAEAMKVWSDAFEGFVGSTIKPFALLGTQVVHGTNYVFAAEIAPVVENPEKQVALVTVNSEAKTVSFADLIVNKHQSSLGYAFTW